MSMPEESGRTCPLQMTWGDEVGAEELLHLHGDVHGYGDDVIEEDHEGQEVGEGPEELITLVT
ncbi:mCG1051023 [Mus musculus]|nr:mCG1051023 [Mus musculus]